MRLERFRIRDDFPIRHNETWLVKNVFGRVVERWRVTRVWTDNASRRFEAEVVEVR